MNIPQDLQPQFIHPTLVVAADHMFAKMFLAGGDEVEELDGVAMPRERKQDSEGFFVSRDASRHGSPDADTSDDPRLKAFTKAVAERISTLVKDQDIAHLHLVMPAEVDGLVQKHLPPDIKTKIVRVRHLDLMKEDTLTVLRRVYEKE